MKVVELTPQDFDTYAKDHELANPWQTSNFGRAAESLGYSVLYLGLEDGLNIKGCTLLLTKNVYLGQSVSYAPRGPLIDYEDYNNAEDAISSLIKYLNNNKIMSLTMDPPIILSIRNKHGQLKEMNNGVDKKLDAILHGGEIIKANPYAKDIVNFLLKKMHFDYRGQNLYFEAILPRWYAVTNLPINSRVLLSKIDKRARTKLRKAAKLGVEILKDETRNLDDIYAIAKEKFDRPIEYYKNLLDNNPDAEIYIARINSEKYVNNSKILYEREIERNELLNRIIQEKNAARKNIRRVINQKMESDRIINNFKEHLVVSTQTLKDYPEGRIIAFCIVVRDKNNISIIEDGYLKEYGNLNAAYLLRWKVIEQYSNSNSRTFNFGEITGGFDPKRNVLYGLNESKLCLRGSIMEYIGEFGIMTNKAMYNLYQTTNGNQQIFKL
jgi:peptidoglycan pentaglycine glycine transferase (the first glycine)